MSNKPDDDYSACVTCAIVFPSTYSYDKKAGTMQRVLTCAKCSREVFEVVEDVSI